MLCVYLFSYLALFQRYTVIYSVQLQTLGPFHCTWWFRPLQLANKWPRATLLHVRVWIHSGINASKWQKDTGKKLNLLGKLWNLHTKKSYKMQNFSVRRVHITKGRDGKLCRTKHRMNLLREQPQGQKRASFLFMHRTAVTLETIFTAFLIPFTTSLLRSSHN